MPTCPSILSAEVTHTTAAPLSALVPDVVGPTTSLDFDLSLAPNTACVAAITGSTCAKLRHYLDLPLQEEKTDQGTYVDPGLTIGEAESVIKRSEKYM